MGDLRGLIEAKPEKIDWWSSPEFAEYAIAYANAIIREAERREFIRRLRRRNPTLRALSDQDTGQGEESGR